MTENEAVAIVKRVAQSANYPNLSDEEVLELVNKYKRAEVWTAETVYSFNQVIQPTTPNGHFYKCLKAGLSGENEPVWAIYRNTWVNDNEVLWEECAIDFDSSIYNTRDAIRACWQLKMAKCANDFDNSIDNQSWKESQIFEHCKAMMNQYATVEF